MENVWSCFYACFEGFRLKGLFEERTLITLDRSGQLQLGKFKNYFSMFIVK